MNRTLSLLSAAGILFSGISFAPAPAQAAAPSAPLEISGWIPYWRTEKGITETEAHLSQLTEVNPFGYIAKKDGSLFDAMNATSTSWQAFFKDAKAQKVRIVPTVMWSDTPSIYKILSNKASRAAHVKAIVDMVVKNGYDGVDIDYEGKSAETRPYFSAFLKELSAAMAKNKANKWVMCTIEAREPLSARYSGTPPANIEYANDLKEINKYCDRVRLMTYDQQTADIQLNRVAQAAGDVYAPIADPAWVEKVVNYMANDISKKKIEIGIATYGYIYQVMPNTDGKGYGYTRLEAFNPTYATDLAKTLGITPVRNSAGELSFTYVPSDEVAALPSQEKLANLAPKGTASAYLAAFGSIALAKDKGQQAPFKLLWWSDAKAIADKVALARKLGVKGVSVFKFDGGADPAMWDALKK